MSKTILSELYKEMQMKAFNHTLALAGYPIETLRGVSAKILTTDYNLAKPLIVQVGDQVYNYTVEGKRSRTAKSTPLDLQMVVSKEVSTVRYLNASYYEDEAGGDGKFGVYLHNDRKTAFEFARNAENVRIVALPITLDMNTDEVQLYSKSGDCVVMNQKDAHILLNKLVNAVKN